MTKAEQAADTILCKKCKNGQNKEFVCGMRSNKEFCVRTRHFILGYEQAEKDLILTWQDIKTIVKLADDLIKDDSVTETEEEYYKAVLDAFNQTRK